MDKLIIEPYKPERDKASITAMLCEKDQFDLYHPSDKTFPDGRFVARYNDATRFCSMR